MLLRHQIHLGARGVLLNDGVGVHLAAGVAVVYYLDPKLMRKTNNLLPWLRYGLLVQTIAARAIRLRHPCDALLHNNRVAAKLGRHGNGGVLVERNPLLVACRIVDHHKGAVAVCAAPRSKEQKRREQNCGNNGSRNNRGNMVSYEFHAAMIQKQGGGWRVFATRHNSRAKTEETMVSISRRQLLRWAAALAVVPLWGCASKRAEFTQRTLFHFNTVCVLGGDARGETLDEAAELCERFEQLFSRTIDTSDVARVNAAGGAPVEVDPLTAELVTRSLEYCEESGGLFDITIGAVSELWDFVEGVVPEPTAIEAALPHVGWQGVEVRGNTVRLRDAQARLDLGGIAKGFMADKLIGLMRERGATSAFVNLGGNVKVWGNNQEGEPWSVGVRDPADQSGAGVIARTTTTNGSLVTSGLYERSFEKDGKRYWHILDPRTGYPAQTNVVSASVFSTQSIDGDGYTKPLFMLERNEALAFVERHEGLQALLVDADGTIATTPGSSFELL